MKAVVFTLGCKVNECESDSLIKGLLDLGYEVSDKLEYADLYIVNTCAVTKEAEKKSRQMASRIKKLNKNAKIIFTGCASERCPENFTNKSGDYLVTGTFSKGKILELLSEKGKFIFSENKEYEELPMVNSLRKRTYVKVQDGCNNFCSYCIIPYLRGRTRSRNPENVKREIENSNSHEIIINGINLSAYNFNGKDLTFLMRTLKDQTKRIRLGSLEVNVITNEFLTALKEMNNFAPHFHLSLQSGSNAVLRKMNRKYTREEYIEKVNLIREYFPNSGITTDVIVGFPTETEQDFLDSKNLILEVGFSDIHVFPFSPREGTVAYKMPDLAPSVKKERLNVLLDVKKDLKLAFANSMLGKTLTFIPEEEKEGYIVGYTENYLRVYVKKEEIIKDAPCRVKILKPYLDGALGTTNL